MKRKEGLLLSVHKLQRHRLPTAAGDGRQAVTRNDMKALSAGKNYELLKSDSKALTLP